MYAHVIKGWTVGHLLLRRLLRSITSVPGLLLDAVIAVFWVPHYRTYWDDAFIEYADGTRVGVMQGLLGWIGELLGYGIGGPLGFVLGLSIYIVDSVFWAIRAAQQTVYSQLDRLAQFMGQANFFTHFSRFSDPKNFMEKSWNIGSVVLGGLFTILPYLAARMLEFFIPVLGKSISDSVIAVGSFIGGLLAACIALPVYPIAHVFKKTMELYTSAREYIRYGIAVIYAKTGTTPEQQTRQSEGLPNETMHSPEFRETVEKVSTLSWSILLFGPLQAGVADSQTAPVGDGRAGIDPITLDPLGVRGPHVLVDPCGHSFNDDGPHAGIREWVATHHTCPISRASIRDGQLVRNMALNDLLMSQPSSAVNPVSV